MSKPSLRTLLQRKSLVPLAAAAFGLASVSAALAGGGPTRPPAASVTPKPAMTASPTPSTLHLDPGTINLLYVLPPDLTVVRYGYDDQGNDRILVSNLGQGDAAPFRIAVLADAQSFSIYSGALGAGKHEYFSIPGMSCGQGVVVLVDIDRQTGDSNYDNNYISYYASCQID
jgi:hypothetical protein